MKRTKKKIKNRNDLNNIKKEERENEMKKPLNKKSKSESTNEPMKHGETC